MSSVQEDMRRALADVKYPGYSRDIVSFGMVKSVSLEGRAARIVLAIGNLQPDMQAKIRDEAESAVRALPGIDDVVVEIAVPPQARTAGGVPARQAVPGIQHVVAVASGKGGVGKSTVAVNLALALAQRGLRVGIVDADVYGPNVPRMLGVSRLPPASNGRITPAEAHGVKVISLAFFTRPGEPVIWRGPMIDKAIRQFFHDVAWGELDIVVVDLPPGTGDASLALVQRLPLDGAIIVSTPQQVALDDALRAVSMFQHMEVPILGLIENMSYFQCPDCGSRHAIFGYGGVERAAKQLEVPLLAQLPLESSVRAAGDEGVPAVLDADSEAGYQLRAVAAAIQAELMPEPARQPSASH
jgi:ATP-binding protein involved in chromosome partitioning